MYIKYNNELFDLVDKIDYYKIVTRKESKSDKTFYSRLSVFIKEIAIDDTDIQDIYDVDFFVIYSDESETIKNAAKYVCEGTGMPQSSQRAIKEGIWCVNEGRPLYRSPVLEENEVGLWLNGQSCSEDWVMDDRCSCSKIIDLYDCSGWRICRHRNPMVYAVVCDTDRIDFVGFRFSQSRCAVFFHYVGIYNNGKNTCRKQLCNNNLMIAAGSFQNDFDVFIE